MDAPQEHSRLRKDYPFMPGLGLTCKSIDLSITLLNIRSNWKRVMYISGHVLLHTDILSFTETCLAL